MTRPIKLEAPSGFVDNGFERLLDAIEAEVRPEIEQKYADEWNACNIFQRWFLLERIEREIADIVSERTAHVSPDSLF